MTTAKQFGRMAAAPERIPIWYWNRHVLLQLRREADRLLGIAGIGSGARALEMGCGNRPYERLVAARGASYQGADLPDNPHADLVVAADGRVPAADGTYDMVLSIQVLEHVPDPRAYLAEARRLIRPGGRLLLSTHGIWVYHPSPEDLWRWTAPGLCRVVEQAGFRVLECRGLVGLLAGALQLVQDALRKRLPGPLRKPFTTVMQFFVRLADKLHGRASRDRDAMIYMLLAEPA